jgi:hypothetical protein
MTIPAIIDSHGKPGIGGATSGVVGPDEVVTVTVTTFDDVLLDAELELLELVELLELELCVVELLT